MRRPRPLCIRSEGPRQNARRYVGPDLQGNRRSCHVLRSGQRSRAGPALQRCDGPGRSVSDRKVLGKMQDDMSVQIYKEIEEAVTYYARANDLELVLHFNDATAPADLYQIGRSSAKCKTICRSRSTRKSKKLSRTTLGPTI